MTLPNLKLLEKIGDGGMASVWKAWDNVHRRMVAVKILDSSLSMSGSDVSQFHDEEKFLEEISHPGIVRAYSINRHNGIWYYVMEYVDGYSFADLLKRKQHVKESDCLLICESVAATIYQLATGRVLFPGLGNDDTMRAHCNEQTQARDPRAYRPELSEGFCQLLESMLVKNRECRVASWRDVYEMCREVESGVKFKKRDPMNAPSSIKLMA